jgi:RNA polymerase sigma-70 factor (ECF subfamily)
VEKKNFTSWIYAIARNVHMDLYRKRRFDLPGNDKVLALAEIPDEEETIETIHHEGLKKAMAQLSHDEQQILWMTKFEKMKYVEVAEVFDCSEGAIKAKVHRTMKNLKDVFFKINMDENY